MKKLLALLLVLGLLFSFVGCDSDSSSKKHRDDDDTFTCDICDDEFDGKGNKAELNDKKVTLCDDCYEDIDGGFTVEIGDIEDVEPETEDHEAEIQAYIDADLANEDFSNENMKLKVYADGNDVVYALKLLVELDDDAEAEMSTQLAEVYAETMPTAAEGIRDELPVVEKVIVIIFSNDGDTLFYEEY